MTDNISLPNNSFTALAELLARQGNLATPNNRGQTDPNTNNDNNDNDDDNGGPNRKRLWHDSPGPVNFIPRFTVGAVSQKYIIIKGIQPRIYCDW